MHAMLFVQPENQRCLLSKTQQFSCPLPAAKYRLELEFHETVLASAGMVP